MISCGVSSSNMTTASTLASAASDLAPFGCGIDRTVRRLALRTGRSIAVDADDQPIAQRPRVF